MNYSFPNITNIADVLPAIEGRDEFVVAEKDGYAVINYNVMFEDTFPDVCYMRKVGMGLRLEDDDLSQPAPTAMALMRDKNAAIRRECRGIIFCSKTGDILRRPFHKFFNVNEREETQLHNLDFSKEHWIDTKLDGSMIAVFLHEGEIVYGTKMVAPDFHDLVKLFVDASDVDYEGFCRFLLAQKFTPIFEFMHPQKRIVIDYGEPALTLLAIRNMITGKFTSLDIPSVAKFGIPVVEQHGSVEDPKAFLQYVHELKNAEGFVIRWADGHRVKIKAHEYLQIHKAKEAILQDRNIVELILEEHLDDIKAHLPEEDRFEIGRFEHLFNIDVYGQAQLISNMLDHIREENVDRKTFALDIGPEFNQYTRAAIFKCWDETDDRKIVDCVRNTIRNNLSKTAKYEAIRDCWFPGVVYNV